jgi:DNA transformation protein and related proteins
VTRATGRPAAPPLAARSAFADMVADHMTFVPDLRITRMFGGYGVFREDRMFALVADDRLYFKCDAASRPLFEAKGLGPFSYEARGLRHSLAYFEAPPEVFEDNEAMREWVARAWRAAVEAKRPAARKRAGTMAVDGTTPAKRTPARTKSTKKAARRR